jgi:hypothetical protein
MPLRVALIVIVYVGYRALESNNPYLDSAFVAAGTLLLGYAAISRYGVRSQDRSGLLLAAQTILGLGLAALGLVLLAGG